MLGQSYEKKPSIFEQAKELYKEHIDHFGFLSSREEYFHVLEGADIVVSTAIHEFFGISVVEVGLYEMGSLFVWYVVRSAHHDNNAGDVPQLLSPLP